MAAQLSASLSFDLPNLDELTRALMVEEFQDDARQQRLYISPLLSGQGVHDYAALLEEALRHGSPDSLAARLRERRRILRSTQRRKRGGGFQLAAVPYNAAQTLAESEFNRYYIRAVCRRALLAGVPVVVYRAKRVGQPRTDSEALIGEQVDPAALLEDLRAHPGERAALGIPGGPGSGISVRLP